VIATIRITADLPMELSGFDIYVKTVAKFG